MSSSIFDNLKLKKDILKRVEAMSEGGSAAEQYKSYYSDNAGYNRGNYSSIYNPNCSYKTSSTTFGKGNINIIPNGSSSMSRTGPNIAGFFKC